MVLDVPASMEGSKGVRAVGKVHLSTVTDLVSMLKLARKHGMYLPTYVQAAFQYYVLD